MEGEKQGKTAVALITGNEILSGKVTDKISPYLAVELRALGVALERITVLPDRVDGIAEEVSFCHPRFDLIFTTGGIGPTHDDVTVEAIAQGMSRKNLPHPVLLDLLKKYHLVESAVTKMASVPEGTELLYAEGLRTPILKVGNIYIFPGVFEFFKKKFDALKERFRDAPFYMTKIFVRLDEEEIVKALNKTSSPGLLIGSYPILHQAEYKVMVTLESKDVAVVKQGTEALLSLLPNGSVWKVE